jgi:redox-sensitive bicupin YhaK (pirin superfamily)
MIERVIETRQRDLGGLATLTYLFEGEIMHRESVGSEQPVRPGEVNLMTAGRGITHSERFERARREGGRMDAGRMKLPHLDEEEFIPLPPDPSPPANPMS